jgi:surface carbohydrate biosynthesis protein (TIGR04326 family)
LLQDFLNVKVALNAIVVYFRIRKISRKVASHIQWFDSTSQVDVTAIVANDLASDFRGYGAARNALWLCLFEAVIKSLPRQGKGLYLMENQSFERALVHAWNRHSKGPIYGFAHGLVREWDLRYALGQTRVPEDEAQNRPRPSLIAVNGPLAEQSMRANGVHPEHLVAVEALRFESKSTAIKRPKSLRVDGSAPLRILMLGEYAAATIQGQMVALKGLTQLLPKNTVLTFRPHPGGTVRPESLPEGVRLSQETKLSLDLDSCDVVIASNVSNASLDAYMHGLPVLIHGNAQVLNGAHLSAVADVRMLASVTDIVMAISEIVDLNRSSRVAPESVFNLDPELPRWRQLLGLPQVTPLRNPTGNAK